MLLAKKMDPIASKWKKIHINLEEHFNKETPCHHLFSLEKEKNVASCAESIIFLQRRDEKV